MSIHNNLLEMYLANLRFKLIICILGLVIFGLYFLRADANNEHVKQGQVIKPSYKPAIANKQSQEGKHIFAMKNCSSCHSVEAKGGCLGPPLDGVGAYRSRSFLLARITKSTKAMETFERMYGKAELMEHPRIPAQQAQFVVQYRQHCHHRKVVSIFAPIMLKQKQKQVILG